MTSPEGKEIGQGYVTIRLDDQTEADYARIRAEAAAQSDIEIPTKLAVPSGDPLADARKKFQDSTPIQVPTEAANPIDEAWRAKVEASVKSIASDALNIPVNADTADFRVELDKVLKEISASAKVAIPADVADADRFRAAVELLVDEVSHEVSAKIPVEVDQKSVNSALASMTDSVNQNTKQQSSAFSAMFTGVAAGWTALGALLSGPAVGLVLGGATAGFLALGVAAEHSTPQVVSAFDQMKGAAETTVKDAFSGMTPTIVGAINDWTDAAHTMGPEFKQASAEVTPALAVINSGLVTGAETVIPAFVTALGSAAPVAQSLKTDIVDLSGGVAQFVTHLDFTQGSQGLEALGHDVELLLPFVAQLLNTVMPLGNVLLSDVVPAVISFGSHLLTDVSPAINAVVGAIHLLSPLLNFMAGPAASILVGVLAFKSLQGAVNGLLPVFNSAVAGATGFANKVIALSTGNKDAIGSFSLMTDSMKKQEVQSAASTLASAKQQAAKDAEALATLKAAAAADASTVSTKELGLAEDLAAASTAALADAEEGFAAATRAVEFSLGPIGIALGAVASVMTLFLGNTNSASQSTDKMTSSLQQLEQAASDTHALANLFQQNPQAEQELATLQKYGVTLNDLAAANNGDAAAQQKVAAAAKQAMDALNAKVDADKRQYDALTTGNTVVGESGQTYQSNAADVKQATDALNNDTAARDKAQGIYNDAKGALDATTAAQKANSAANQQSAATQADAASQATALGVSVATVTSAYSDYTNKVTYAVPASLAMADTFLTQTLAVDKAKQTVSDYFTQADQQASQAAQSLSGAEHSYEQSIQSVADAEHSAADAAFALTQARQGVATAEQSVQTAMLGVTTAQQNYQKAVESVAQAQAALNTANQQAVQDLKNLQLQLNDQQTSQDSANVSLFDAQTAAAVYGIDASNAVQIAGETVTAANEAQVKAAIALVQAQNAVADSANQTTQTQQNLNTALAQGVAGNPAVVAAKQALQNAQEQVAAAAQAEVTAQQAVITAEQGVVSAEHSLTDAQYNAQKAAQAVTDAKYNEKVAAEQVTTAEQNLKKAQDDASTSLDANTLAGQRNIGMLQQLQQQLYQNEDPTRAANDLIQATAQEFGLSAQQAANFLEQEHLIPPNFQFSVGAVAEVDMSQIDQIEKQYHISGSTILQRRDGGPISGPGGPRDDRVPVMASNGEYIVNAKATADNFQALEAINAGRYADGGLVAGNVALGQAGIGYQTAVDALTIMGFPHPPSLAAYVPDPITGSSGGQIAYSGPTGVTQWAPQILQALAMLGQPASWLGTVERRMNQESGGNPVVVNRWDSNWARGTPSVGLMQVIGPTFRSWAGPFENTGPFEYGVSVDPLANTYAGLNYALHRYGSLSALNRPGGYDNGGYLLPGITPVVNATGKPEMTLPPSMSDTLERLDRSVQGGDGAAAPTVTNHWHIAPVVKTDSPHEVAVKVASEVQWQMMTTVGG